MGIKISNLQKSYASQNVLKEVSLQVNNGEVVGLLGPNGAGKSTLMRCICGEIMPDSGEIHINDINLHHYPQEAKKEIGFLAEHNPLYLDDYVQEYLQFVASIKGANKNIVDEIIEIVGLTPEKHKKISQLSKGYKQRVGLAQALLGNPENLILDEPTNGLDPNQILEIRKLVTELAKDKTIILSTHIMQEVEALCQRVILIHQGQIISDSSIEDFRGQYNNLEDAFSTITTTPS